MDSGWSPTTTVEVGPGTHSDIHSKCSQTPVSIASFSECLFENNVAAWRPGGMFVMQMNTIIDSCEFRTTFGDILIQQGVPIPSVAKLVRYSDGDTLLLRRYARPL
tara:strand:- start:1854 stop:2171 length:318 start_codon:yes stop_codon:yes gene_type:complete